MDILSPAQKSGKKQNEKALFKTIDANEAVAQVAYQASEVIAIYPITPSSTMGEWADQWQSEGKPNAWGIVPTVVEMQSEGGAAGAVHGALQGGALSTTFTASQGLLLMIPNMYKIAGELTPVVFHVAARSLAAQGLSIFGDHSDVMAARGTGFALLSSGSVQEAMDLALIAHAATLKTRIPFLHFFDGFRTSHEISKIEMVSKEDILALLDKNLIREHRGRALSPDHPVLRGTAQNPDVYFQARESVNRYYNAIPETVEQVMRQFGERTGRYYHPFEYQGAPDAERVVVIMGSGVETVEETARHLNHSGCKTGVLKVRLYRPFDNRRFLETLPLTVKSIAVLDRTKEPGSAGEPLYLDCVNAFYEGSQQGYSSFKAIPRIAGGRYGLSSKEFTPAMVKAVFDHLEEAALKNHFTVGIHDDVTHTSLKVDASFSIDSEDVFRGIFYGLGSDGTVGANKNSIKIIGENTDNFAQGYFVYDSKKAGAVTISHLRFGLKPIRAPYLVEQANFVGCHQFVFLERYDMLKNIRQGGTFLLNAYFGPDEVWQHLPGAARKQMIEKKLKFYVIDAYKVAEKSGMGGRINTVMQVCFFAISGVLPKDRAIAEIKKSIEKTYGKKGEEVVSMNLNAVDRTLEHLFEVNVPAADAGGNEIKPLVADDAPLFVRDVLGRMIEGHGDELPVSAFPADGTYPTGTAKYEKRNLAQEIPVWDPQICIQCGKCAFVCPHAVIRVKVYEPEAVVLSPETFKSIEAKDLEWKGLKMTIQVAPEDCTGCGICVVVCPAKNKSEARLKAINMRPQPPLREAEKKNWNFFLNIPELDRRRIKPENIRQQQVQEPLFEFSSSCAGCGETPYLKLLSQLFGDRSVIANATGCSSIYGGNLPTTPWTRNAQGRGPAWSNSLFEDNAEFGLGIRLALEKQREIACGLLKDLSPRLGEDFVQALLGAEQNNEADIYEQRERVEALKTKLKQLDSDDRAAELLELADSLTKKSVWIVGGDGWAYDIGYGGLDHVLAGGRNVNVLVLDTEVYSNTGGQMSKSTPRAAIAKFAAGGKPAAKKDLGLMAMTYGNVYVASVAMGARDEHTLKAFLEAEAYQGPSLIIAYSHCVAHGINMTNGMQNQKAAVDSGQWLLYRFHPDRIKEGQNPLSLDSRAPSIPLSNYLLMENRFKMLTKSRPEEAKKLFEQAQKDAEIRWKLYEYLAGAKSAPEPPRSA